MSRTAGVLILTLATAIAGCQTMKPSRARVVRAPTSCVDQTAPVYFPTGAAELTAESRKVITETAARARGCTVTSINVMGLADATGDAASNLDLSRRRAAAVSAAIAAAGLTGANLETAADGEQGAITAKGQAAPLRRRAEVTFHLAPKK